MNLCATIFVWLSGRAYFEQIKSLGIIDSKLKHESLKVYSTEFKLDVVIPVLMPNPYLEINREHMKYTCDNIRVIYVIDLSRIDTIKSDLNFQSSSKELFIFGKYGSPGKARNAGLNECTAEFVCFWDVDDRTNIEEVCASLKEIGRNKSQLAVGKWSVRGSRKLSMNNRPLDVGLNPGLWRFIFQRSLIGNLRFLELMWGEDHVFLAHVFELNPKVSRIQHVLYEYNTGVEDSLTRDRRHVIDLKRAFNECLTVSREIRGTAFVVVCLMLLRQSLTIMKSATLETKCFGMRALLLALRRLFSKGGLIAFVKSSLDWNGA